MAQTISLGVTVRVGRHDVSVRLPEVSRVRLITTASLATFFTALWIAAPWLLPFAVLSPRLVLCGVTIPFGCGYVTLLLAEGRIKKDLRKASEIAADHRHPSARLGQAQVAMAERQPRGPVLEGEVLPR